MTMAASVYPAPTVIALATGLSCRAPLLADMTAGPPTAAAAAPAAAPAACMAGSRLDDAIRCWNRDSKFLSGPPDFMADWATLSIAAAMPCFQAVAGGGTSKNENFGILSIRIHRRPLLLELSSVHDALRRAPNPPTLSDARPTLRLPVLFAPLVLLPARVHAAQHLDEDAALRRGAVLEYPPRCLSAWHMERVRAPGLTTLHARATKGAAEHALETSEAKKARNADLTSLDVDGDWRHTLCAHHVAPASALRPKPCVAVAGAHAYHTLRMHAGLTRVTKPLGPVRHASKQVAPNVNRHVAAVAEDNFAADI